MLYVVRRGRVKTRIGGKRAGAEEMKPAGTIAAMYVEADEGPMVGSGPCTIPRDDNKEPTAELEPRRETQVTGQGDNRMVSYSTNK